jgi:hypothetical protein
MVCFGEFHAVECQARKDVKEAKLTKSPRIAVHFRSPKVQNDQHAFYEILKNAVIYETDGICSELHLDQGGNHLKAQNGRSELHIGGNESELKVYVPLDKGSQELCFMDGLPKGLLEWIMTDPSTQICEKLNDKALDAMQKVLLARKIHVSEILDRVGIVSVEMPDDHDLEQLGPPIVMITPTVPTTPTSTNHDISALITPNEAHSDSEAPALDIVVTPTTPTSSIRAISAPVTPSEIYSDSASEAPAFDTPASSISSPPVNRVDVDEDATAYRRVRHSPSTPDLLLIDPFIAPPREGPASYSLSSHSLSYTNQVPNPRYNNLLNMVISAASITAIPNQGAISQSLTDINVRRHDDVEERYGLTSVCKTERNKMVGAAGELFVGNLKPAVKEAGLMSK